MQSINKKFYFLQTRICHAFPTNEKYMCLTFYISCITDKTLTRNIYTYRDILFHLRTFVHHITNVDITHKVFKVLFPFQNRKLILWKKYFEDCAWVTSLSVLLPRVCKKMILWYKTNKSSIYSTISIRIFGFSCFG